MVESAPIALFAYKRADHLATSLAALQRNPEAASSILYLFCDGARGSADHDAVQATRRVAHAVSGFAEVHVRQRETNFGLARSIMSGVSEVLAEHGQVVVVEDDIVVAPSFLRYMNAGLQLYADHARVASIHGYCYPVQTRMPETFFLRGADCWGWATWARAWRVFEPDGRALLARLQAQGLTKRFDLDGAYGFTAMLQDQIDGKNDSWAIRWHASCFLSGLLTLYPGRSLVQNIGHDGSGTHGGVTHAYDVPLEQRTVEVGSIEVTESLAARRAVAAYFRRQHGLAARLARRLRRILPLTGSRSQ